MPLIPPTCPKCKSYDGHHLPRCEDIDFDEAKRQLEIYYSNYLNQYHKLNRDANLKIGISNKSRDWFKSQMQKWKAKFNEVKHENNKLRKKNESLQKIVNGIDVV